MVQTPFEKPSDFLYPRWVQRWPAPWIRRAVYYLLSWPATQILARPRIEDRERLRDVQGPVLVICNHVTYLDVGFVLAALPHRLRNLAVAMEGERIQRMRRPPKEWLWLIRNQKFTERKSATSNIPMHVFTLKTIHRNLTIMRKF